MNRCDSLAFLGELFRPSGTGCGKNSRSQERNKQEVIEVACLQCGVPFTSKKRVPHAYPGFIAEATLQ